MCSGSEAGSYLRLIDCVHHSTPDLRAKKKKTKEMTCAVSYPDAGGRDAAESISSFSKK